MHDPSGEKVIRGTIQRVTFHNPQNGYSVLQLEREDRGTNVTVVGICPNATAGSYVVARGEFSKHPKYGLQLAATSITESVPSGSAGIQKYLESGVIKGIGPVTAERLVEKFGEKTLEVIYQDPDQVAKLPGIGRHKAAVLHAAVVEQQEAQQVMRFLLEHNVTTGLAGKIYERYGNRSIEILSQDPYLLARDLRGVGFSTADSIAMNLGLKTDSPQRLKAGIYYALERASDEGHCYQPARQLLERTALLLGFQEDSIPLLEPCLRALEQEGFISCYEDAVYLKHLERAEDFVAQFVAQRCEPRLRPDIPLQIIETSLKRAEAELHLKFSAEQAQALRYAAEYRLFLVTGGPGCGKTTLIRALSTMYRLAQKRLALAAPTGRAAQRMAQVCDISASTIHRLLRYDPHTHHFVHGINQPLPFDAVIIDESSMIDLQLAKDLFSAIPSEATLILVGDKDQLPSVGPGRVFADLIGTHQVKTISLSQLFRRAEQSRITTSAHMINSGLVPDIPSPDGVTKTDAYFIAKSEAEEAASLLEKLVSDQIPKKFGFEPHEIAVLTPTNRGELGTERLNQRLQERLNPAGSVDSEQELSINGINFRVGDRVCQRVNNYQIHEAGVFNGDLGEIYSVERASRSMVVELWDGRLIRYSKSDLGQLSLAYAITVHRAQGCEMPCVVLALHDSHYTLLERQLIYTAVTRAKKLLILVGSKRALTLAVKRTSAKRRCTRLKERIQAIIK